ncbi:MAG: DUF4258 domain-containing protein [Candidatus Wallbacteria bacterium]|nr:DUF4258 domain-containing protein [Candidatus Wallbacteria bacterium]
MKISRIQGIIRSGNYFFSQHADEERMSDDLTISEIEESILEGRILEEYCDDQRGASCLIAGFTCTGKPIHTVCAGQGGTIVIITVYIPGPPKFITPFERGSK